jgi:hypothetical protein
LRLLPKFTIGLEIEKALTAANDLIDLAMTSNENST